ncbi:hypothetical protein [Aquimarina aquimarini]|uniref:hypothetical protein n=1 Tax=Aquimarina aquimarini TaxID=1191734 RepID=UPI000D5607B3|nr:hypothetical protein [Aquimarina aquimarini]
MNYLQKVLNTVKKTLTILSNKPIVFSKWLNKESKVKQASLNLKLIKNFISGTIIITLFCYSFTTSYYASFGVDYFLHFEYVDIYNFTLGRFDLFFNSILLVSLLALMFGGFFVKLKTNKEDEYFSKGQILILGLMLFLPLFFVSWLVFDYSNSIDNVLITIALLGLAILSIYLHRKAKHDIFLIFFIILISIKGKILGKVFAKERFQYEKDINLIDVEGNEKLKNSQLVIGQNKTTFIIINKRDSVVEFIPKSKVDKVSLKSKD